MKSTHTQAVILAAIVGTTFVSATASADIVGFNYLTGWTPNTADTAPPISLPDQDTVQLTTGSGNLRSIWYQTPQTINQFTASFTYRASNTTGSSGLSFILQNDTRGQNAIGDRNTSNGFPGIDNSFAIGFNYYFSNPNTNVGIGRNGSMSGSEAMNPLTAVGRDVNIRLVYNGGLILTLSAVDALDSSITFDRTYVLSESIASTLGGTTAIVGFGAGTNGGPPGITQTISDFSFIVPAPSTLPVMGMLGLVAARRRRA